MDKDSLKYHYSIVAENKRTADDCIALLQKLADDASDVRIEIPGMKDDSFEVRRGINSYLQGAVDTIRRMSKNKQSSQRVEDDSSSEDSI